jgi:hypothetical protein
MPASRSAAIQRPWRASAVWTSILFAVISVASTAPRAHAFTLLTAGKRAVFRNHTRTGKAAAQIRVVRDRGLATLGDPTKCPSSASLQIIATSNNLLVGDPAVDLRCGNWRRIRGGYLYEDSTGSAGGVRQIRYTTQELLIKLASPGYTPVVGPVGYVEAWLTIGTRRYLVRFHNLKRNDERAIVARRPSKTAAAGEAAFWETMWGEVQREEEALTLLNQAVARDPKDGRSQFLLGMLEFYRYANGIAEDGQADDLEKDGLNKGKRALDRSLSLLWDGRHGDSRILIFAAAATYVQGVAFNDPALIAQGFAEMDHAIATNPTYNGFIVPVLPGIAPTPALSAKAVGWIDGTFYTGETAGCAHCFNTGFASHSIEGILLLFGDLYAQAQRPVDARNQYELAIVVNGAGGWRYLSTAQERAATVDQRVALYADGDPGNDPPVVGFGNGEGICRYCHNRD